MNTNFYSLWFDSTGNRTRVYRFSSRRSIHPTTDQQESGVLGSEKLKHAVSDSENFWSILQSIRGSCLLETGGLQMSLFRNTVQSLFAVFVRIYKMKLFPIRLPLNVSLYINLFLRLVRCFVTAT